jgi:hypothetical protein
MRNLLLTGLIVLNVVLAAAVLVSVFHVPPAQAQPIGMSGNFLMVSGSILGSKADIVYVIDLENRQLTTLYYDRSKDEVSQVGTRDLVRDLARTGATERAGEARKRPPSRNR